ncbi:hypothetical protein [Halomarina ordinaria]|uniref:Uncharacterized protein n=1 Tax=Halomarina ordinaria TaxID=3033939 RepID=A0ABD5U4N0_9EURY|nr:hypothetical protein [Halomarina sp. PSRA2]
MALGHDGVDAIVDELEYHVDITQASAGDVLGEIEINADGEWSLRPLGTFERAFVNGQH